MGRLLLTGGLFFIGAVCSAEIMTSSDLFRNHSRTRLEKHGNREKKAETFFGKRAEFFLSFKVCTFVYDTRRRLEEGTQRRMRNGENKQYLKDLQKCGIF